MLARLATLGILVAMTMARSAVDRIPVPSADASPDAVVAAFIAAINARDSRTIAAITPPSDEPLYTEWFTSTLDHVSIDAARAFDEPSVPGENVYVHVDFVVRGGDGSFEPGVLTGWGFTLARADASERWLVVGSGVG